MGAAAVRIEGLIMKRWFAHNLFLKLIALGLAIITWIYVNRELMRR